MRSIDWLGRLDAALSLLKAAVKAPPLTDRAETFQRGNDSQECQDMEDEDRWPPTADELRESEFLAVLRSCRPDDLEEVVAILSC